MKIGTMTIDPLVDGEMLGDPARIYPEVAASAWAPYAQWLEPQTGLIPLTIGGYLIRFADRAIVVDLGSGEAPRPPFHCGGFRSSLLATGLTPADITDVIFTHLHLDHIGWASYHGKAYFPNAVYRCDRRDWEHFMSPRYVMPEWEARSSNPETDAAAVRLAPARDRMEFWQGDATVLPGITAVDAHGHTPGTTLFLLESGGERGALLGDIVHTVPELLNGWAFRSHVDVRQGTDAIKPVRDLLAETSMPFSFSHVPALAWYRIERDSEGACTVRPAR
jgi:glyoxylase-like metal-dependent hydrolase (beta-lactamase superfamily II)